MKRRIAALILAAAVAVGSGVTAHASGGAYLEAYDDARLEEKDYAFEKPGVNKPTPFEDALLKVHQFDTYVRVLQPLPHFYSKMPNPNRKNPVRAEYMNGYGENYQVEIWHEEVINGFFEYDAQGNLTTEVRVSSDGSPYNTKQYTYDGQGRLLSDTDVRYWSDPSLSPTTITWQYAYDAQDRIISAVNDVDGSKESYGYTYDAAGNVLKFTDNKDGIAAKTSYTRDAQGNVLTCTTNYSDGYAMKESHALTYDAAGRIHKDSISVGGPNMGGGDLDWYIYDETGYLKTYQRILRNYGDMVYRVVEATYDAAGNVVAFISRSFEYDMKTKNSLTYDAAGNLLSHSSVTEMSNEFLISDAPMGTMVKFGSFDNRYTYDAMGNLLTYTHDLYTGSGRKKESIVKQYEYDAAGNLVTYTKTTTTGDGDDSSRRPGEVDGYRVRYYYE